MPSVRLIPPELVVEVPAGTRLVDAIRRASLPIASSCGDDLICARCAVRIVRGSVSREAEVERDAKARNRVPSDYRLACAVRVHTDVTIAADYWGEGR